MPLTCEDIEEFIRGEVAALTGADAESINGESVLIGSNRVLDSADLVVLLLAVEEFASDKLGVAWDWTSDSAMSEARSVLRNVAALAQHLAELQPA
jgi:acyl carrier protein